MAEDDTVASGDESEGWLTAIDDDVFEEEEGLGERCLQAAAFASRRREMGWRLTHEELHDRAGLGLVQTTVGPIHFERGQGQQGRAWDCSLVLVKYLEKNPEEVRGKGVLELGCGVGLPGVAAAVLGANEVILTDMAAGLPAIERTIELNPEAADRITGSVLEWGDETRAVVVLGQVARTPISVILCSDLLYGDSGGGGGGGGRQGGKGTVTKEGGGGAAEMLAITLSAVCSLAEHGRRGRDVVVLSCHERRFAGDKGAFFFEVMAQRGFEVVETVSLAGLDERYSDDCGISLTRIKRKT